LIDTIVHIFNNNTDLIKDFSIKMESKHKKIKMDIDIGYTDDVKLIKNVKLNNEQKIPNILGDIILQHICKTIQLNIDIFDGMSIPDSIVKINNLYNEQKIFKLRKEVINFDNELKHIQQLKKEYDNKIKSYETILSNKGFHSNDIEPHILSDLLLYI
jgi:hypothetical protein